jgi:Rab-GTPase-TBC domain
MSTGSTNDKTAAEEQDDTKSPSVKPAVMPIEQGKTTTKVTPPTKPPPLPSRFTGFSASLPGVPWGGSSSKTSINTHTAQQSQSRKVTGPFAWLNRAASVPKEDRSPPLQPGSAFLDRRNTSASVSTIGSNPDLMLKTLDEASEANAAQASRPPARTTLRDRFKLLRMREEAGITSLHDPENSEGGAIAGLIGRSTSLGVGVASPSSVADDKEGGLAGSPVISPQSPVPPSIVSASLAPGAVSGISAAASDAVTPIDWDFWQAVVNDGPQAVARTSPEELAQSIASGIPQTIRGVIWQVLASSKSEDLESVYQDLLVRGTDKQAKDAGQQISLANGHANGSVKDKGSIASSGSSVHSDHSTPATSTNVGVTSSASSMEKDPETLAKVQAKLAAERQKRVNEDAAALQKLEKMIKRDMGARTSYSKYAVAAGFQEGLFNVCKAYALFDEGVGYPQGMNFIIMPLLFTMPEEEAFCLLVRLMNKYGVRELFIQDMPGLHLHLYQFERLLEDLEPALYCHLNRRGVTPKLYATQWFLTLFAYRFPLQLVMRVFDLVLSEGLEGAILKLGMAVVQRNVPTLLAMDDMAALTNFLKEKLFDVYIDQTPSSKSILESGFFGSSGGTDAEVYRADILVQDACAINLTPEMLKIYRAEWTEKVRLEKDREIEIDNYRSTIATQAAKIRSLEERAEKSDTEHVQIATDLVRLKVENQEFHDSNESLRGQVEELKKVAESEASAVEARLKGEMERVMQRNIEVQNENRLMEESMAEMETSLVETKMKYAEVSCSIILLALSSLTYPQITENHETLKQKWNDLRKALD